MSLTYKLGAGWESVEKALHTWLLEEAGLTVVRWELPTAPVPGEVDGVPVDFGMLAVRGFYRRGLTPSVRQREELVHPPGTALESVSHSPGALVVAADVITHLADGADSAFPRLLAAARALSSQKVLRALRHAGLGLQKVGDVRALSSLLGISKQGRATLEVRFNVGEEMREWGPVATGLRTTLSS